ncbi:MAG: indole-3-glycerol phosphate synthase TrpC [Flavobacteriia bacterium]
MENILEIIIANKKKEVEVLKKQFKLSDFEKSVNFGNKVSSISASIRSKDFGIIAEIKRKSPSAGDMRQGINPVEIAKSYVESGMAGISILTDYDFFGGTNDDVIQVKKHFSVPVLRKEFIVDEIQIFESKAIGADAILLIAEVLTAKQVREFTIIAKSLGLEVIMELHDFQQLDKFYDEIDILGVNNRNLKSQITSLETSFQLAPYLPKDVLKISESGIKSAEEIKILSSLNFNGALIGESILKNPEMDLFLQQLNQLSHEG